MCRRPRLGRRGDESARWGGGGGRNAVLLPSSTECLLVFFFLIIIFDQLTLSILFSCREHYKLKSVIHRPEFARWNFILTKIKNFCGTNFFHSESVASYWGLIFAIFRRSCTRNTCETTRRNVTVCKTRCRETTFSCFSLTLR